MMENLPLVAIRAPTPRTSALRHCTNRQRQRNDRNDARERSEVIAP